MARITLKNLKPVDPTALPKAPTSRARRALQRKGPAAPPKLPALPPNAIARATASVTTAETSARSVAPPKKTRSRRTKPAATDAGPAASTSTATNLQRAAVRGNVNSDPASRSAKPDASSTRRRNTSGMADRTKPAYTPRGTPKFAAHAKAPDKKFEHASAAKTKPAFGKPRSSSPHAARTPSESWSSRKPQRATPTPAQSRPPRHENPDDPRLSKRMSELGLCSRREADEWIENGWVKVDGNVVVTLGVRVSPHARIDIDPAAAQHQSEQVTILLNKPIGYVSGQAEDGHEPAMVLIKPENRWTDDPAPTRFKLGHLRGLAPAGRLDIDSTGLLVFTQDGRIAKHLIGRDSAVEKEYLVRVEGTLSDKGMKLLQHGLELDGVTLRPARVSWQNEDQLRFVLREGRKRQIRRMCELVGLVVTGLKRVRSGSVPLGPLPVGQWRYLRRDEKF
jgi:23S rRNA pseudouridine2604 synthase